jgi:3-oxoacyl-[acyl-carrier-protein] synthase-3
VPRIPQILATGSYVPEQVVTNADLEARLGEPVDQWLRDNVGIRERRFMATRQTTSDLVTAAANRALQDANISAADLDLIVLSTDTPDFVSPATAVVVQDKLGAVNANAFDINSACAGWVRALDQAARYLMTEPKMRYVLVAGGYGMSRYLDWQDKHTATIFADGAGVAILGVGQAAGYMGSEFKTMGQYHKVLGIYGGAASNPATPAYVATHGAPHLQFVERFPKEFNTEHWPQLIYALLERHAMDADDIDHYYFTQVNLRGIEMVMDIINQPMRKTHYVMDKWGYTGSPCVVMALDDALAQGEGPQPGDKVMFIASGGGVSMAASLWTWGHD